MESIEICSGPREENLGASGATIDKSSRLRRSNPSGMHRGLAIGFATPRPSQAAVYKRSVSYREYEIEVVVKAEVGHALGGVYNRYRLAWKISPRGRNEEIASFPEHFYFMDEGEALNCGEKRARVFVDSAHSVSSVRPAPAIRTTAANRPSLGSRSS
jgi:hypothetical protein